MTLLGNDTEFTKPDGSSKWGIGGAETAQSKEQGDEAKGAVRYSTDKPVRRTVVGARTHGNFT